MIKIYQLFILLVSLYIYSSNDCEQEDVSKKSVCHDKTVKDSGKYCCFIKAKANGKTSSACVSLTKEEKENIKKTIEEWEKAADVSGAKIKSLDCKSSFIELGLISLIFLLL